MRLKFVAITMGMLAISAIGSATTAIGQQQQYPRGTQFVRYSQGSGEPSWGILEGQTIQQLSNAPYLGGTRTGRSVQRNMVKLEAPVDPQLVVMTALNFRSHLGQGIPAPYPGLFIVPANSIIGPEDDMVIPPTTSNYHYEAELVAVIGRRAENVSVEDASDYVFGISAGNDGSARDWQGADLQWARAKGSRNFNAVGPVLVTGLDYANTNIEGRLAGERVQGENTRDMIFSMDEMISYISHHFTLEPGDLVWTGTMGQTRRWSPGQEFEVDVQGVGVLRNRLVVGPEQPSLPKFERQAAETARLTAEAAARRAAQPAAAPAARP